MGNPDEYFYPDSNDKTTHTAIDIQEPFKGYWDKSEEYVLSFFERIIKKRHFNSLLDLGCGEGRLTVKYSNYFDTVTALDPDKVRLQKAKKNVMDAKIQNVTFIELPFLNAQLPKNHFDVILCSHVIQHIPTADLLSFIEKIHEILKRNGLLIIFTMHSRRNKNFYLKSFVEDGKLYEPEISKQEYNSLIFNKEGILPARLYSMKNLREYFKKFKLIKITVFHDLHSKTLIDNLVFRDRILNLPFLKNHFGTDIMVIASKSIS